MPSVREWASEIEDILRVTVLQLDEVAHDVNMPKA